VRPAFSLPKQRVAVFGVLNLTPDSFSDGGRFGLDGQVAVDAAVVEGLRLFEAGADVVDVGGESTRPGAHAIPAALQMSRVLPVIEGLAKRAAGPISIDTRDAEVAAAALEAGARIVNDVSGGAFDPRLLEVAAGRGATLILGHMRGNPGDMADHCDYEDLLEDVARELGDSTLRARAAGAHDLIVDPGLGFAKTAAQSWQLLSAGEWFRERLGVPVLMGPSRKSFLAELGGANPADRDAATHVACAIAAFAGADAVRVHDPAGAVLGLAVGCKARRASEGRD